MLFSDEFVFLHLPKTGGTFVRATLQRVLAAQRKGRSPVDRGLDLLRRRTWKLHEAVELKHLGVHAIPARHRHKLVVGCTRNPFDRLVSQYEFRWWARYPANLAPLDELRAVYPHFPDLSFEEWYGMHDRYTLTEYLDGFGPGDGPGLHSRQLLDFYSRDRSVALEAVRTEDPTRAAAVLADVRFLRTERLNQDLYDLLVEFGIEERWLEGLLDAEPILPPESRRKPEQRWQHYYTPGFLETVRRREAIALTLFPEYDPLSGARVD